MKTAPKKHGVVVTVGKTHKTKSIWNRGHRMITYRRQPLKIWFKSRMVNDKNQHICGGWHLAGLENTNLQIERQLLAGRKPLGSMVFWEDEAAEARKCAERLRKAGLCVKVGRRGGGLIDVEACQDIRVGDIGDLGDLVCDYASAGVYDGEYLCDEVNVYAKRTLKTFLGRRWDIESCPPWLTGLILGYPIENTISFINGDIT